MPPPPPPTTTTCCYAPPVRAPQVMDPYAFWEKQKNAAGVTNPGYSYNSLFGKMIVTVTDAGAWEFGGQAARGTASVHRSSLLLALHPCSPSCGLLLPPPLPPPPPPPLAPDKTRELLAVNDPSKMLMVLHPSGKTILGANNLAFLHGCEHKALRKSFLSLFTRKALSTYAELQVGCGGGGGRGGGGAGSPGWRRRRRPFRQACSGRSCKRGGQRCAPPPADRPAALLLLLLPSLACPTGRHHPHPPGAVAGEGPRLPGDSRRRAVRAPPLLPLPPPPPPLPLLLPSRRCLRCRSLCALCPTDACTPSSRLTTTAT